MKYIVDFTLRVKKNEYFTRQDTLKMAYALGFSFSFVSRPAAPQRFTQAPLLLKY
jgi:hypothetical protein